MTCPWLCMSLAAWPCRALASKASRCKGHLSPKNIPILWLKENPVVSGRVTPPDGLSWVVADQGSLAAICMGCWAALLFASICLLPVSSEFEFNSCVFCKILISVKDLKTKKLVFLGKFSIALSVYLILLMFLEYLIGVIDCSGPLRIDGQQKGLSVQHYILIRRDFNYFF